MTALIRKELTSIFCSSIGSVFSFVYLIACGAILWILPGNFNILDAGYSTLDNYFTLSPILFIILIPALTMRAIAEEKRNDTLGLLRSRPVGLSTIWFGKWITIFVFVTLVILSTLIYLYTIYILGNPVGNADFSVIVVSYLSLIILVAVFVAVGLFASSITDNQIVAFITALISNFVIYFGFDLLSSLFSTGSTRVLVTSFGLSYHFGQMQKGVVEISNVSVFVCYFVFFYLLSLFSLHSGRKEMKKSIAIGILSATLVLVASLVFSDTRFDFTKDKQYTISDYSRNLMKELAKENTVALKINVYLEGDLNTGFQRLRNAVEDMLSGLNKSANHKIDISFVNPASLPVSRDKLPEYMSEQDMPGIVLNEVDRNGKLSRQLIYPYAQAIAGNDTLLVPLLKNIPGNTAEENLNASAENLEFLFIDAIRLLTTGEEQHIAFIEGHGELQRAYLYDAEEALSKYYFVNRGQIGNDISILDGFRVVIIAGTTQRFSETEKYILDQYLMKGGRILWLIDGVYLSHDQLVNKGRSPSIKNETGLDDILFTYGVRIEPKLLQDSQSTHITVHNGDASQSVSIPWYYSPLLLPSPDNPITKDIPHVKAQFASSISLLNNKSIDREVLLTTSRHSKAIPVPEPVDFDVEKIQANPGYFDDAFIPVAASLSGQFRSAFENRSIPDSVATHGHTSITTGKPAKMIVVSASDVIRNDVTGQGDHTQVLPMGFDRATGTLYGNRDFIVNAVNWLANDDDSYLNLRAKTRQMNLLNKKEIYENRNNYAALNTAIPILILFVIFGTINVLRRRKYTR